MSHVPRSLHSKDPHTNRAYHYNKCRGDVCSSDNHKLQKRCLLIALCPKAQAASPARFFSFPLSPLILVVLRVPLLRSCVNNCIIKQLLESRKPLSLFFSCFFRAFFAFFMLCRAAFGLFPLPACFSCFSRHPSECACFCLFRMRACVFREYKKYASPGAPIPVSAPVRLMRLYASSYARCECVPRCRVLPPPQKEITVPYDSFRLRFSSPPNTTQRLRYVLGRGISRSP